MPPGFLGCRIVGSTRGLPIVISDGITIVPVKSGQFVVSPHGFALVGRRRFIIGIFIISWWRCILFFHRFSLWFEEPLESLIAG